MVCFGISDPRSIRFFGLANKALQLDNMSKLEHTSASHFHVHIEVASIV
jgi:hypothetical protein